MNILSMHELLERLNVSRGTIYRWMESKEFPEPLQLNKKRIGWKEEDIEKWLDTLDTGIKKRSK